MKSVDNPDNESEYSSEENIYYLYQEFCLGC